MVNINDVPQAIQLALGPAFLLTGIASVLNVMTGRLTRIIDRGRQLTERGAPKNLSLQLVNEEIELLEHRRYLASSAIAATTLAALLVCLVITTLFMEVVLTVALKELVGVLFSGSTIALVVGLTYFLREVYCASVSIRIRTPEDA